MHFAYHPECGSKSQHFTGFGPRSAVAPSVAEPVTLQTRFGRPAMLRDSRCLLCAALLGMLASSPTALAQVRIQINGGNVKVLPNGQIVQDDSEDEDDEFGSGRLFAENRRVSTALRGAATELEAVKDLEGEPRFQRLQRTIGALQQILDLEEDFWYPTDEARSHFTSAKSESARLVAGLPEDGLDWYVTEYGPVAKAALAEAVAANDVNGIAEVTRRYFHTPAGVEAAYRLGCLQLDRAEALAAALVFERVRASGDETYEPMLSLRTAVAWGRAGLPEKSVETLDDFRRRSGGGKIKVGGRQVEIFAKKDDALPWLVDVLGVQPGFRQLGHEEWTMFRGDSSRTATSRPTSPLWREKWRYSTIEDPGREYEKPLVEVVGKLRELEKRHRDRGLLTTPAMHPLVVKGLVVFRTLQNVRAVRLDGGEQRWRTIAWDPAFKGFLENGVELPQPKNNNGRRVPSPPQNGLATTPAEKFIAQRSWRDLTAGTLSSDGRLVYSIEELDFLNGFNAARNGMLLPGSTSSGTHNKLMAFELGSGLFQWELGGPAGEDQLPLDGSFFLGAPLPLSGRQYCLVERKGEIQLVMFEIVEARDEKGLPQFTPVVRWTQSLVTPRYDLDLAPLRRMAGVTPSYADGMMVCSTAAGAIVAVDLARRELAWGYPYRISDTPTVGGRFRRIPVRPMNGNDDEERWLDSAPTIADDRVVVTPRDSSELHCIDLLTGKAAWPPKPRADGLYVAGVHEGNVIVVGRSQVQAWRLDDGTPGWSDPIPVGMPSGRGVQVGSLYHLPLLEGAIATIDLEQGRLLAKSTSTTGRVPGNLVAANGMLVSLAPDQVIGFQSIDTVEQGIQDRLAKDPNNATALAERGELRLHRGLEKSAMEDLERAIAAGAGRKSRELFVAMLLEGLRLDFPAYRERADAALELIEEVDRKRAYLRLHARGMEQIGEFEQAFYEYVRLAGLDSGSLELEQTSGRLAVRTDRWIRPRLAQLLADAPEEKQAEMQAALTNELQAAVDSGSLSRLRRLAAAYARLDVADDANLALLEELDTAENALERTLVLERLRRSDDDRTAAFATAELARMAVESPERRAEDAIVWFDDLAGRFADIECLDGRTGRELVDTWSAQEDVEPILARPNPWPTTKAEVSSRGTNNGVAQTFAMEIEGSAGPYFQGWTFELENTRQTIVARDAFGRIRWKANVRTDGQMPRTVQGSFVRIHGHLVVCCLGTYFCVVDALAPEPRTLWTRTLVDPGDPTVNERTVVIAQGVFRRALTDAYGRSLGTVGAVTSDTVYYTVGTRLYAADLQSGEVYWELRGTPRGAVVRADEEHVVVVDDSAERATLLRADDGARLGTRNVPAENDRLLIEGTRVLAWTNAGEKQVLALRNLVTAGVEWAIECDRKSKTSIVAGEDVAVLEPSGLFRIVRIADGEPLVVQQREASQTAVEITVLRSPTNYLLFPNDPAGVNVARVNVGGVGVSTRVVHGDVTAFDRTTGEPVWTTRIEEQGIPLGQPLGVPTVVLTSLTQQRILFGQPRVANANRYRLALLDIRDGRLVLDERGQRPGIPFLLDAEPEGKHVAYTFYKRRVDVRFADEPQRGDDEGDPDAKPNDD